MEEESFDVVVIGSGPAGYVAAIRAAQLGMKTACIEKQPSLGGTCLNVGCIPSKTLLHATEVYSFLKKQGQEMGILAPSLGYDWEKMLQKKAKVIQGLNEGIKGLFAKNKVASFLGEASFISQNQIKIRSDGEEKKISSRFFIIATGSEPSSLPFLPFDEKKVLSSTGALSLEAIPKRLTVIGAGVIGVELGSVFQRLGSEVVFVEFMDRVCPSFDGSLSRALQETLTKQGMKFFLQTKVQSAQVSSQVVLDIVDKEGNQQKLESDVVLVAVGRRAFTKGLNLESIGITTSPQGKIPVDGNFTTSIPHILAIGDVIDGPMLAHKSSEEGVLAAEICAGKNSSFLQYLAIPNVVYTHPEVASVGFTEEDLKERKISFAVGSYYYKGNSRARCVGEEEGFVKVLVDKDTDKILGVHIIGASASELIAEAVLALGKSVEEIGDVCHAHPTLAESFKEACLSVHKRAIHK